MNRSVCSCIHVPLIKEQGANTTCIHAYEIIDENAVRVIKYTTSNKLIAKT